MIDWEESFGGYFVGTFDGRLSGIVEATISHASFDGKDVGPDHECGPGCRGWKVIFWPIIEERLGEPGPLSEWDSGLDGGYLLRDIEEQRFESVAAAMAATQRWLRGRVARLCEMGRTASTELSQVICATGPRRLALSGRIFVAVKRSKRPLHEIFGEARGFNEDEIVRAIESAARRRK